MADALGWGSPCDVGFPRLDDRGDSPDGYRVRDWRPSTEPAFNLTSKARDWKVRTGANSMKHSRNPDEIVPYERSVLEPAPTVDAKAGSAWTVNAGRDWKPGGTRDDAQQIPMSDPAPTIDSKGRWFATRPATTICGDPRVAAPGGRDRAGGERQFRAADTIRITERDALVLQSFRPDYPVVGSRTSKFRQIGNACPPRLAAAVLAQFVSA